MWKRTTIRAGLSIKRIKRLQWFWKYVVRKKPLYLDVTLIGSYPMLIESFTVLELTVPNEIEDRKIYRGSEVQEVAEDYSSSFITPVS